MPVAIKYVFMHHADELAHYRLEQGATTVKIWLFEFAAECNQCS